VLLQKVIAGAVEAAIPAAEAGGIAVGCDLGLDELVVLGDPSRLQQVFDNLLSNAIKFTPRGGRVEVALRRRGGEAEIHVSDTGKGIDASLLTKIFERFRQADSSSTRSHAGLGIGLAIVRHLVSLHGGSVHAESAGVNQGARFTVRLPIASDSPPELAATGPRPGRRAGAWRLDGLRVLLVDDEEDAREGVALMLRLRGADVTAVGSAPAALAALERETPDIVVSDLAMPGQDGYWLVRQLRAREAAGGDRTPALALSAYARSEESARSIAAGFDRHLAKPVDEPELLAALRSLLRSGPGLAS
jgi:CheY-like chemotaxis protein